MSTSATPATPAVTTPAPNALAAAVAGYTARKTKATIDATVAYRKLVAMLAEEQSLGQKQTADLYAFMEELGVTVKGLSDDVGHLKHRATHLKIIAEYETMSADLQAQQPKWIEEETRLKARLLEIHAARVKLTSVATQLGTSRGAVEQAERDCPRLFAPLS